MFGAQHGSETADNQSENQGGAAKSAANVKGRAKMLTNQMICFLTVITNLP
jgi:hypothetical protein